jgi:hypothetical protein
MANITIVKLKVRRGTDSQRQDIVLDQGEVGYTLDSKRLFVGDGATYGGIVAGNKAVGPFASVASLGPGAGESPYLQVGDIGYADSRLYILTGASSTGKAYTNALSGWAYIGNIPDDTSIEFDSNNKLSVKNQGLDSQNIGTTFFGDGLLSSNTVPGEASVAFNTDFLELSSATGVKGRLTPKQNSITKREIKALFPSASGLKGGDGEELALSVNEDQFKFDANNKLELKSVGSLTFPISTWAGPGDGTSSTEGRLGGGLTVNTASNRLETTLQSVDGELLINDNGVVSLNGTTSAFQENPFLNIEKGLVTQVKTSIFDVVTATGLSGAGAGDGVPIGSILPHAQAFAEPPAGESHLPGPKTGAGGPSTLSAFGVNFIIKYAEDPVLNIFNGAPNQVANNFGGQYSQQICHGLDSGGGAITLSSAGFITMALSGQVRNPDNTTNNKYDRYAIPVYSY